MKSMPHDRRKRRTVRSVASAAFPQTVGIIVAIGVIAHDFCDGFNTVSLMLVHRNTTCLSVGMLVLDAIAPMLGTDSTLVFRATPGVLMLCVVLDS